MDPPIRSWGFCYHGVIVRGNEALQGLNTDLRQSKRPLNTSPAAVESSCLRLLASPAPNTRGAHTGCPRLSPSSAFVSGDLELMTGSVRSSPRKTWDAETWARRKQMALGFFAVRTAKGQLRRRKHRAKGSSHLPSLPLPCPRHPLTMQAGTGITVPAKPWD